MNLNTISKLLPLLQRMEKMQQCNDHEGYYDVDLEFHKLYLTGHFLGVFEFTWKEWEKEQPKEGFEMLGFPEQWIDLDFNPLGIRAGFLNGDGCFTSARWCNYHDSYETDTSAFPSHWIEYPFLQLPAQP